MLGTPEGDSGPRLCSDVGEAGNAVLGVSPKHPGPACACLQFTRPSGAREIHPPNSLPMQPQSLPQSWGTYMWTPVFKRKKQPFPKAWELQVSDHSRRPLVAKAGISLHKYPDLWIRIVYLEKFGEVIHPDLLFGRKPWGEDSKFWPQGFLTIWNQPVRVCPTLFSIVITYWVFLVFSNIKLQWQLYFCQLHPQNPALPPWDWHGNTQGGLCPHRSPQHGWARVLKRALTTF